MGGDGWCAKSASFQNQNSLGASLDPLLCTVDIISDFNPVAKDSEDEKDNECYIATISPQGKGERHTCNYIARIVKIHGHGQLGYSRQRKEYIA